MGEEVGFVTALRDDRKPRFASQRGGRGRFAGVTLRAEAGAFVVGGLFWAPGVERLIQEEYAEDLTAGVADARRWHLERGGEDASITVIHVEFVMCDLTPEAIRLAATAAAWTALGNAEDKLRFDRDSDCCACRPIDSAQWEREFIPLRGAGILTIQAE